MWRIRDVSFIDLYEKHMSEIVQKILKLIFFKYF